MSKVKSVVDANGVRYELVELLGRGGQGAVYAVKYYPAGATTHSDAGVTSLTEELGRDVTVADVLPSVRRHLAAYLSWQPYEATPDYEPRPEPGRAPRIELVRPGAPA